MREATISVTDGDLVGRAARPSVFQTSFRERFQKAFVDAWSEQHQETLTSESVDYLEVREPSFLVRGYLVHASVKTPGQTSVLWCLFFEADDNSDVVYLSWPISTANILAVAEETLKRVCLCFCKHDAQRLNDAEAHQDHRCAEVDQGKVADFFLEFLNHDMGTSPENPGLLAQDNRGESGTSAGPDEHTQCFLTASGVSTCLDWWPNKLMDVERTQIDSMVRDNPLCVVEDTAYSQKITVCVLAADVMVRREYRIFTAQNGYPDSGIKGEITQARDIEILLRGLPPARARPGARFGFPPRVFDPTERDEWQPATDLDIPEILETLSAVNFDASQFAVMRHQRLEFYDLELLELQRRPGERARRSKSASPPPTSVLWKRGYANVLDGSSAPIYEANEYVIRERPGTADQRLIRSEKQALDYARFFGRCVSGDNGPFRVLTSVKDKNLDDLDLAGARLYDPKVDSVRAALEEIRSPEAMLLPLEGLKPPLEGDLSEDQKTYNETYKVDAFVLYGQGIFESTFVVEAGGSIEMVYDRPLIDITWSEGDLKTLTVSEVGERTSEELSDSIIVGQLTSEKLAIRGFRHCRFRGRVNLQHLISDRLSFENCLFENGLDLSGAQLQGGVAFIDCVVRQDAHYPSADSAQEFQLTGLRAGQLQIENLTSACSLSASSMRINGAVEIRRTAALGKLELDWLTSQSVLVEDTKAKEGISLHGSVVEQFMSFEKVKTTDGSGVNVYGSIVKNNYVWFKNVSLDGDLRANFLRVGTGFFIDGDDEAPHGASWIGGSVDLSGARLQETLRIHNTNVRRSIDARRIVSGAFRILGPGVRYQTEMQTTAIHASIGNKIDLTDADIAHDVTIVDVSVGEQGGQSASLLLCNAKIDGNVNLFLAGTTAQKMGLLNPRVGGLSTDGESGSTRSTPGELDPSLIDFSSTWTRGVDLTDSSISGDVDLTSIKCPLGDIQLAEARIERNLYLRRNDNDQSRNRSRVEASDPRRCESTRLVMTGLECKGTTDITGLRLTSNGADGANVIANLATFGKELKVSVRNSSPMIGSALDEGIETALYDELDLTGSTIGELSVSVNDRTAKTAKTGIILQNAHVGRFTAILRNAPVESVAAGSRKSNGKLYPKPLDLSFAEINWWKFEPSTSNQPAEDYIQLLAGDQNVQRHIFRSIEQNLVNQGDEEAADEVHKEMRKRLRKQNTSWKRTAWDTFTDSETSPFPLLLIVFAWFVLSAALFSNPANIVASAEGMASQRARAAGIVHMQPAADEWGWENGVWIALRYHVPVATFTAQHEWQPANETRLAHPTVLRWERPIRWVSPEEYANMVLALHWLVWPIILYLASRKFFRRADK